MLFNNKIVYYYMSINKLHWKFDNSSNPELDKLISILNSMLGGLNKLTPEELLQIILKISSNEASVLIELNKLQVSSNELWKLRIGTITNDSTMMNELMQNDRNLGFFITTQGNKLLLDGLTKLYAKVISDLSNDFIMDKNLHSLVSSMSMKNLNVLSLLRIKFASLESLLHQVNQNNELNNYSILEEVDFPSDVFNRIIVVENSDDIVLATYNSIINDNYGYLFVDEYYQRCLYDSRDFTSKTTKLLPNYRPLVVTRYISRLKLLKVPIGTYESRYIKIYSTIGQIKNHSYKSSVWLAKANLFRSIKDNFIARQSKIFSMLDSGASSVKLYRSADKKIIYPFSAELVTKLIDKQGSLVAKGKKFGEKLMDTLEKNFVNCQDPKIVKLKLIDQKINRDITVYLEEFNKAVNKGTIKDQYIELRKLASVSIDIRSKVESVMIKLVTRELSSYRSLGLSSVQLKSLILRTSSLKGSNFTDNVAAAINCYPTDWLYDTMDYHPIEFQEISYNIEKPSGFTIKPKSPSDVVKISSINNVRVLIHELGHQVELTYPELVRLESIFYHYRTDGEKALNVFRNIFLRKDQFLRPYAGKDNSIKLDGNVTSYELLSVGLELAYTLPIRFFHSDPAMASWIYGILLTY